MRARGLGLLREGAAQATVEMAVVLPVLIVLALISYNLMVYACAVARFDRVAPDIVIAHGVSPAAGEDVGAVNDASSQIEAQLVEAMGDYAVEVEVALSEEGSSGSESSLLSLVAPLKTYTCTLRYEPWPSALTIAGVDLGAPIALTHERAVTIDPWHPGVVV